MGDLPNLKRELSKEDVVFKRRHNARRYIVRVDREANIVVTLPPRGTQRDGLALANEHADWLRVEQAKARERGTVSKLRPGDQVYFRGERIELNVVKDWGRPALVFADQRLFIADANMNLRRPFQAQLRAFAKKALPPRVRSLASQLGLTVKRVTIRDQRSRWGSCSSSGGISLNLRLVQAPDATRDYVILHELMHLREMNHGPRFWELVEAACPDYREHERWLKEHQSELAW